mmetsp:Transcript_20500/g.57203  ORF Transcript_20500/g.57203 Transcript_20500/m.57203 type:complete len:223 (-) Transcript_20500:222-890(-)
MARAWQSGWRHSSGQVRGSSRSSATHRVRSRLSLCLSASATSTPVPCASSCMPRESWMTRCSSARTRTPCARASRRKPTVPGFCTSTRSRTTSRPSCATPPSRPTSGTQGRRTTRRQTHTWTSSAAGGPPGGSDRRASCGPASRKLAWLRRCSSRIQTTSTASVLPLSRRWSVKWSLALSRLRLSRPSAPWGSSCQGCGTRPRCWNRCWRASCVDSPSSMAR